MSSPTQPGRHILAAPAWPYANGPRHIGHVSGFALPCDMFSRYQRMAGNRVLMVSGTDEHGTPIQVQADAEGVTARELADRYNRVIAQDLTSLGMTYDLFTRTTTLNHYAGLFPTDLDDIASRLDAAARLTIASQRKSSDAKQSPTKHRPDEAETVRLSQS